MITQEVLVEARKLWDYHHLYHKPAPSDCILVLGSHDLRVADRGAELYLEGLAPILLFSGGLGYLTKGLWTEPEADQFARIALDRGVPSEAIFIENRSTNTGENIQFSRRAAGGEGIAPSQFFAGAEAVYGAAQLCDVQKAVARQGAAGHLSADRIRGLCE
ncbi:YdcF family protein [Puia sp. P3]|uniref:YdcF family protein n=1 Tax=Puia sp. P3 TaxID=3423952 RepID=UPI003D676C9B